MYTAGSAPTESDSVAVELPCGSAREMQNDGHHRQYQQQVNDAAGHFEGEGSNQPKHDENKGDTSPHGVFSVARGDTHAFQAPLKNE